MRTGSGGGDPVGASGAGAAGGVGDGASVGASLSHESNASKRQQDQRGEADGVSRTHPRTLSVWTHAAKATWYRMRWAARHDGFASCCGTR